METDRTQIAPIMSAPLTEFRHVMALRCGYIFTVLQAHLAERVRPKICFADFTPLTAVPLICLRVALVTVIVLRMLFLVRGTILLCG